MLKATRVALGAAALPSVASVSTNDSEWTAVESPVGGTLYDVEGTTVGAYAVGDSGGVLERTETGWQKVIDGGPTGNGRVETGRDSDRPDPEGRSPRERPGDRRRRRRDHHRALIRSP